MKKSCSNCEFNFNGICADEGLYGYGGTITDFDAVCDSWRISFIAFCENICSKNKNVH